VYESFYKLYAKPFRLSPDPSYFYPSSGHKRALSYLLYGLNQGEGFVVITGAPGTGKTTLAQKLLSQIDPAGILVAHLSSTQVEAEDLLRLVANSFKLRSENVSKAALLKDIESFLIARSRERKRCLLVVDEAQNLPERSIEELRMLSNFQVSQHALLQIFLLGQEQFRSMLESTELEQLQQRVIANFHLNPLDVVETQRYIESRLRQSGWANDPHIADDAYGVIYSYTGGLPRRINMFCDRLFLYGYMEGLHVFTRETVTSVIEELKVDVSPRGRNVVFTPVDRVGAPPVAAPPAVAADAAAPGETAGEEARPATPARPAPAEPSAVSALPSPPASAAPPAYVPVPASGSASAGSAFEPSTTKSFATSLFARISELETQAAPAPKPATATATATETLTESSPETESLPPLLRTDRSPSATISAAPSPSATGAAESTAPQVRSRWTAAVGAVALVLVIGVWLFPYLQDSQPVPATGRPVATTKSVVPEVTSVPAIDDPTERILSESTVTPAAEFPDPSAMAVQSAPETAPPNAVPPAEIVAPPREAEAPRPAAPEKSVPKPVRTERADPPIARDAKPATAKTAAPAPRAAKAPEPNAPPQPTEQSPAPSAASVQALPAPARSPAATIAPSGADVALAPEPSVVAPTAPTAAAQVAIVSPPQTPEPIAQLELAQVLLKFTRYYEEGNLDQFAQMFSADIQTEDRNGIAALREDYGELFQKTVSRQIILGDIRWDRSGATAQGDGPFELRIRPRVGDSLRVFKGTIRFQVEKRNGSTLITSLRHTAR
jgi:putative secretion ATPase (PEP-CTERM system associated)